MYKLTNLMVKHDEKEKTYKAYLYETSFDSEDAYDLCQSLFRDYPTKKNMLAAIEHERDVMKNEDVTFLSYSYSVIAEIEKQTVPLN